MFDLRSSCLIKWVKIFKIFLLTDLFILISVNLFSQAIFNPTKNDSLALEKVIVEKYYKAHKSDLTDSIGGKLPKGAVTYRIYIDLKPGYKLQAVYGNKDNPLIIETTTEFFNDTILKASTGDKIVDTLINQHNILLDSWLSMGCATNLHHGILKKDDNKGGVITNRKQLKMKDGLLYGDIYRVLYYGNNLKFFKDSIQAKRFYVDNATWANLLGAESPIKTNRILVAQLTTNGKLSFVLNIQIKTPEGGTIRFCGRRINDNNDSLNKSQRNFIIYNKELSYKMKK